MYQHWMDEGDGDEAPKLQSSQLSDLVGDGQVQDPQCTSAGSAGSATHSARDRGLFVDTFGKKTSNFHQVPAIYKASKQQ